MARRNPEQTPPEQHPKEPASDEIAAVEEAQTPRNPTGRVDPRDRTPSFAEQLRRTKARESWRHTVRMGRIAHGDGPRYPDPDTAY